MAVQARHTYRDTHTHTLTRPLSPLMGTDKRQAPSLTNRTDWAAWGQLHCNHFHVLLHLDIPMTRKWDTVSLDLTCIQYAPHYSVTEGLRLHFLCDIKLQKLVSAGHCN